MRTLIFQNSYKNIARISALKVFIASLKPQKASRKPPGSYKKSQGKNPYNIFVANLGNSCLHKFILSLTDLYLKM
jgi:hypothetical protein